jgi:hypothetical protein
MEKEPSFLVVSVFADWPNANNAATVNSNVDISRFMIFSI